MADSELSDYRNWVAGHCLKGSEKYSAVVNGNARLNPTVLLTVAAGTKLDALGAHNNRSLTVTARNEGGGD
ncbi:MAG: hypothetical protein ABI165_17690 [Bryobacteraceae bacterium]